MRYVLLILSVCALLCQGCARSSSSNSLVSPTVSAVSPNEGPVGGGTQITVTGTGFTLTSTVAINGKSCTDLEHVSATSLSCLAPSLTDSTTVSVTVDVSVTNRNFTTGELASGTLASGYTYHPPPTVVSATQGFFMGGTTITVTGTGFRSGASVTIGSASCTSVAVASTTSLTCVAPSGSPNTSANIKVTNVDDQSHTLTNGFTWRQVNFNAFVDGNGTDGLGKDLTKNGLVARLANLTNKMYLTWQENDGTADQIRASVYNGDDAAPTFTFVDGNNATGLNFDTLKSAQNPATVVHGDKLIAVWDEPHSDTNIRQLRARQYNGDDGAPNWSFIDGNGKNGLNRSVGNVASNPAVSSTGNNLFVAYSEIAGAISQIRIKKYDGAAWSDFDNCAACSNSNGINVNPTKNGTAPAITSLSGRLFAAWVEPNGAGTVNLVHVQCNDDETTGDWEDNIDRQGATSGMNVNTGAGRHGRQPRLWVHNNKVYAIWSEASAGAVYQIQVARFDGANCEANPGTSWVMVSPAAGINKDTSRNAENPQLGTLTLDDTNYLYATWAETNGTALNIRVALLSNEGAGTWTFVDGNLSTGINKSTARDGTRPFLFTFNNKLYTAWHETNGTNTTIRVKVGR